MTDKKQKKTSMVKVKALYDVSTPKLTLWGINFTADEGDYLAEICKDDAEALVKSKRVEIVK